MSIFTIGDLHLSIACDKPMDIFPGWKNYVEQITENWKSQVSDSDTVVLAGDISWGMTLQEAGADFEYIDALPGKKVILKGNHDYWWNSRRKME
ncbi:MAG: serine/threonine protein phosphatase, partial [Oscillospiraceae bacterium]|nr:serine/threonine protein phosphatase [Oscillospiraceae bacterium]